MKLFTVREKLCGVQLNSANAEEIANWCGGELVYTMDRNANGGPTLLFDSDGINSYARPGDWILMDGEEVFHAYGPDEVHYYYEVTDWKE